MKLKRILAGAMALVMVAGSLLVAPVETKAGEQTDNSTLTDLPSAGYLVGKTDGVELVEGHKYVITFDAVTDATAVSNWNTPSVLLYQNSESAYNSTATNFKHYAQIRSDAWTAFADGVTGEAATKAPADWAVWLEACKAGTTGMVEAEYDGDRIIVRYEIGGVVSVVTLPITEIAEGASLYVALTTEFTAVSDIKVVDSWVEEKVISTDKPITGITLDVDSKELAKGDTYKLTATVNPADTTDDTTVTWTTSNPAVATVNNGNVKAVGVGTATITASVKNGAYTDTVTITVPVVPVTSIDLSANKTDLDKGDIVNVVATVNPADTTEDTTITWTSSNTQVATVDANGTVTAVGGGNATITATIGNVSKDIKFKVTAQETVVENTTLDDMTINAFLSVVSKPVELKKNHTYTITFDSVSATAESNWETPAYAVYTSDEGAYNVGNWSELFLCRADIFGWPGGVFDNNTGAATFPSTYTWATTAPADWTAWLAECVAGTEGKITAKYDGSNVTVTYEIAGAKSIVTIPHSGNDAVYLSLTGEKTNITDIKVADEYVKTITGTGDFSMVLPLVLVLFGGAVILVASKKRFA